MIPKRIEICGGIASGKTTLCNLLREHGVHSEFENFKSNPFWALFYTNPSLHAFETEVTFLLQHYSQIKMITDNVLVAFDYSLLQDMAYADVNLSGRARRAFDAVYRYIQRQLPPPTLIVHLQCGADEELRRVQLRSRQEETIIQVSYLEALNTGINRAVEKSERPALQINSAVMDFAHDPQAQKQVVMDVIAAAGS